MVSATFILNPNIQLQGICPRFSFTFCFCFANKTISCRYLNVRLNTPVERIMHRIEFQITADNYTFDIAKELTFPWLRRYHPK